MVKKMAKARDDKRKIEIKNPSLNIMTFKSESDILTVSTLAKAIKAAIGHDNIPDEHAEKMAEHMLNFFGFHDKIIDNMLEPQDRDVFYTLEDYGLMSTEREETTLWDGREWRINYWRFRKDKIFKLANETPKMEKKKSRNEYEELYSSIPEEVWMCKPD